VNQTKLRATNYNILHDAVQADADPSEMEKIIILPASFTSGLWYMKHRKKDAWFFNLFYFVYLSIFLFYKIVENLSASMIYESRWGINDLIR